MRQLRTKFRSSSENRNCRSRVVSPGPVCREDEPTQHCHLQRREGTRLRVPSRSRKTCCCRHRETARRRTPLQDGRDSHERGRSRLHYGLTTSPTSPYLVDVLACGQGQFTSGGAYVCHVHAEAKVCLGLLLLGGASFNPSRIPASAGLDLSFHSIAISWTQPPCIRRPLSLSLHAKSASHADRSGRSRRKERFHRGFHRASLDPAPQYRAPQRSGVEFVFRKSF